MPDICQAERAKIRPLRPTQPLLRGVGAGMTGLFNLYDQRPLNALTGRAVSMLGMSGNPLVLLRDGPALQGNIFGGADVFTTATLEPGTTELVPGTDTTFVWIGSLFSLTYGGVMCRGDDASGNGSSLRLKVTTGGEAQFSYVDTTPAAVTATTSGAAIAVGEPIILVGTKRGSTVSVYCKNKSASASGGNGGLRTSGRGVSLNFAGSSGSTANGGAANHLLAATFNRALAPSEVQALLDNPWQLFGTSAKSIYAAASGGAGGVSASASISEAADSTSGAASVMVVATGSPVEAGDSVSAAAVVSSGVVGSASISEAADSAAATAVVSVLAAGAAIESADTIAALAVATLIAQCLINEAPDLLTASAGTESPVQESFARAPAGDGYSPRRLEHQARPASVGGVRMVAAAASRPVEIEWNER